MSYIFHDSVGNAKGNKVLLGNLCDCFQMCIRDSKYSTQAGFTVAFSDIIVPDEKVDILAASDAEVERIEQKFRRGLITEEERYNLVIKVWNKATKDVTDALLQNLDKFNNINMMATSGARGNNQQIRQLAGMRGLMADSTGRTIELPIKANFLSLIHI